ncbi:MAG: DUF599 domain-containing protein [Hyphomicrobium sp.]
MPLLNIPTLDVIAAAVFMFCWLVYGVLARSVTGKRPSLLSAMRHFRQRWIERMCERENHTADATLLSNLLRGALFFASTTVFILGGLVALLGTAPKVAEIVAQLPYATSTDPKLAEIKALILIFVFVYAFFKFTWSAWQYNVLAILIGAMPDAKTDAPERRRYGETASRVLWLAGESYNNGIRAYYFAIPLMAWFIDTWLFLAATLIVTFVLYRREFHSPVLIALKDDQPG